MKYFFNFWDDLKEDLSSKNILLFLDYDGTLAPISKTPDEALITQETREVLAGLTRLPQCHLVIISGRKLSDLKHMIDLPNITYVGNHGFEIAGAHLNPENFIPLRYRQDLAKIRGLLKTKLSSVEGIWLEDKDITLTLHFRLAGDKGTSLAKKVFKNVCRSYLDSQRISVAGGKKVLEVRPAMKWNKGEAALWLLAQWRQQLGKDQMTTMYVGDDLTDEDAFGMLDGMAVTIKIGASKRSSADYYLRNQKEIFTLLKQILVIKS